MAQIVVNTAQAEALFDSLNINKQKNILRSAIRKAINPVLQEAKSNFKNEFQTHTGEGFKSLGLQMYRKRIGVAVGARIKAPFKGYYARFLDTGTKERFRKVAGGKVSTGKIKPSLFFNSAASARQGQAGKDLETGVIAALNKAINSGRI